MKKFIKNLETIIRDRLSWCEVNITTGETYVAISYKSLDNEDEPMLTATIGINQQCQLVELYVLNGQHVVYHVAVDPVAKAGYRDTAEIFRGDIEGTLEGILEDICGVSYKDIADWTKSMDQVFEILDETERQGSFEDFVRGVIDASINDEEWDE